MFLISVLFELYRSICCWFAEVLEYFLWALEFIVEDYQRIIFSQSLLRTIHRFKTPYYLAIGLYISFTTTYPPPNPIQVASATPLGSRLATNDETIRDLGYQSKLGNMYLNTFGDGVGCKNASTRNTCGDYCAWLTTRNGASIQDPSNPLVFQDLNIRRDLCNGVPQMGPFCPILWGEGEKDSSGLGITNVIEVNTTHGLLLTRPTFHDCLESPGAGLAVVKIEGGKPVCSRPWGTQVHSWGPDEPHWGQLSSLIIDGYMYTYANGPKFPPNFYNTTVLARVPLPLVFDPPSYEYYHGPLRFFTSERIHLPSLSSSSSELLPFGSNPQGQVIYSPYYKKYIMFGSFISTIYAKTADYPWGPWSCEKMIYAPRSSRSFIYTPHVLQGFVGDGGKWFLLGFTDDNELPVVNITWV